MTEAAGIADDLPAELRTIGVEEFAGLMEVHPRTVERWIAEGDLPAFKKGRVTRILVTDALHFLRTHPASDSPRPGTAEGTMGPDNVHPIQGGKA